MKKAQKLSIAMQDGVEVVPGDLVVFPKLPGAPALTGPWTVKSTGVLVRPWRRRRKSGASPMVRAILKVLETGRGRE